MQFIALPRFTHLYHSVSYGLLSGDEAMFEFSLHMISSEKLQTSVLMTSRRRRSSSVNATLQRFSVRRYRVVPAIQLFFILRVVFANHADGGDTEAKQIAVALRGVALKIMVQQTGALRLS